LGGGSTQSHGIFGGAPFPATSLQKLTYATEVVSGGPSMFSFVSFMAGFYSR
jgi:hypothetical protein